MSISDDFSQAEFAAKHIASKSPIKPAVAIVLGSGLGGFADEMTDAVRISYNDIPHFARSTAVCHAGQLVLGNIGAWPVVVMQGRVHLYEGYPVRSVVFPMRVFSHMGVRAAILTNAAGGINGRKIAVVFEDDVLGLVHLYSVSPDERLDGDDLEFTVALARQLGVALRQLQVQASLKAENQSLRDQLYLESELVGTSSTIF